jgi:APA family basic amino acid/polyamine antiporter
VFTATAIVVANMVGTGVYTSLGFQVLGLPTGFPVMLLWIVGGIAALCGALSYAELAAALPRSGGEYHFLSRVYHPSVGFVAGFVSATVGFAAPVALAAMAFASYFQGIVPTANPLVIALGVAWLTTLVHLRGLHRGSLFQNIWTCLNVALIAALVVIGFGFGKPQPVTFLPQAGDWRLIAGAPFATSLVFVMYAYSGWNASTYIVNEIREPNRNVPRSVLLGTLLVLLLYVGLNTMFLHVTPISELTALARKGDVQFALAAGSHLLGDSGGKIVGALICVGLVATISSMTWIGPRVAATMGEDHPTLRFFARKTAHGTPAAAMVFQAAVATLLIATGKFEKVLEYIQFSLQTCAFLTVLGVFVLRFRRPDLDRPYRTWGYPVTPLIFLVVSAWMMIFLLKEKPVESLAGLGTLLAGLLLYFLSPKSKPDTTAASIPE